MALNFSYILVILGALSYSNGFKLLSSTGRNVFLPGELTRDFSMNCKADSAYEYCIFEHNGKKCEFEWKRNSKKVEIQEDNCSEYKNRIRFTGDYDNHICEMQITDITSADEGEWSCELEEYKLWGRGNKDKQSLIMKISDQSRGELPILSSTSTIATTFITAIAKNNESDLNPFQRDQGNGKISRSSDHKQRINIRDEDPENKNQQKNVTSIIVASISSIVVISIMIMFILHFSNILPLNSYKLGRIMGKNDFDDSVDLAKEAKNDMNRRDSKKKHPTILRKGRLSERRNTPLYHESTSKSNTGEASFFRATEVSRSLGGRREESQSMIPKNDTIGDANHILNKHLNNAINPSYRSMPPPMDFMRHSIVLPLDDMQT